jgi:broad specificity phosphatase PhoE
LQRCRETAAPFEKLMETHARIEPAVGEIVAPPGTEDRAAWLKTLMPGRWPDAGPAYEAWRKAVFAAVESLPDDTAVFSHFIAINAIAGLLMGDNRIVVFRPAHCSITRLERRAGRFAITELGSEAASTVL